MYIYIYVYIYIYIYIYVLGDLKANTEKTTLKISQNQSQIKFENLKFDFLFGLLGHPWEH